MPWLNTSHLLPTAARAGTRVSTAPGTAAVHQETYPGPGDAAAAGTPLALAAAGSAAADCAGAGSTAAAEGATQDLAPAAAVDHTPCMQVGSCHCMQAVVACTCHLGKSLDGHHATCHACVRHHGTPH
jgi:hypothetical protein